VRLPDGYICVGYELLRELRLLTLGVNHEAGAVNDLRLIGAFSLKRNSLRVSCSLHVQTAAQAENADQGNISV
jgi:hypothetical protein